MKVLTDALIEFKEIAKRSEEIKHMLKPMELEYAVKTDTWREGAWDKQFLKVLIGSPLAFVILYFTGMVFFPNQSSSLFSIVVGSILATLGVTILHLSSSKRSNFHKVKAVKLYLLLKNYNYSSDDFEKLESHITSKVENKFQKNIFISFSFILGLMFLPLWNNFVGHYFKTQAAENSSPMVDQELIKRYQEIDNNLMSLMHDEKIAVNKEAISTLNEINKELVLIKESTSKKVKSSDETLWPLIEKLLFAVLTFGIIGAVLRYFFTKIIPEVARDWSIEQDFANSLQMIILNEKQFEDFVQEHNLRYEDCFPQN